MRANASLTTVRRGSETVLSRVRSDPPVLFRPTPDAVYLAGGAAGPLGGDETTLELTLGPGTTLEMRSVAASLVLPGPTGSRSSVTAHVGAGANLEWHMEPLVSVRGSDHVQRSTITAEPDARLRWSETVVLGRTGEEPGRLSSTVRFERDGEILLHHEIRLGDPGWHGPAVMGGHRFISHELVVGHPDLEAGVVTDGGWAATWPISEDVWFTTALASSLPGIELLMIRLRA